VWFTAPASTLGPTCLPQTLAAALGISADDIDAAKPIQVVSAGVSALIVPLRSLEALRRCTVRTEAFARLAALGLPSLVYFFCRETHFAQNDLCARFFFEANGVREDPATGNGAAFLGAYLLEHRLYPAAGFTLGIEQGYEVGRPSLVLLRARGLGEARDVRVGLRGPHGQR
jgi:trans-2,3-dihydro-3-hydroxyanthranilate isomerase